MFSIGSWFKRLSIAKSWCVHYTFVLDLEWSNSRTLTAPMLPGMWSSRNSNYWWECKRALTAMQNDRSVLKKINKLSYEPATALLGIYPKELKSRSWRDPMIIGKSDFQKAWSTLLLVWEPPNELLWVCFYQNQHPRMPHYISLVNVTPKAVKLL